MEINSSKVNVVRIRFGPPHSQSVLELTEFLGRDGYRFTLLEPDGDAQFFALSDTDVEALNLAVAAARLSRVEEVGDGGDGGDDGGGGRDHPVAEPDPDCSGEAVEITGGAELVSDS